MLAPINSVITSLLLFFYQNLGSSLGLAIIFLTIIIRLVLVPVTLPSLKSAKKMQDLKPALDRLKKKFKDPKKLQQAQLQLYKQNKINPASGCLPQIVQIIILISLYRVLTDFIGQEFINGIKVNLNFLWLDLSQPDPFYILPVVAGVSQLFYSLLTQTGTATDVKNPKNKAKKKKEEDKLEMAQSIQKQMVYTMPLMTGIIALKFASGLALYWSISTIFSLVQQIILSGPGGLQRLASRLTLPFKKK